jgi:Replication-relaxation
MEQTVVKLPLPRCSDIYNIKYPLQKGQAERRVAMPDPDIDLNPLQQQVLEQLAVFHHATADLPIRRLRLSPNSLRHVQKQIHAMHAELEADRFVEILTAPKPRESRFGSAPYVYTYGRLGHKYLREKHLIVGRYRDVEAGVKKAFPMQHRLAVNEFLLKALLFAEDDPDARLIMYLHEKYWKGKSLKVQIPGRYRRAGLSPDLLVAFDAFWPGVDESDELWFPVEINLGEMWRKDWEEKVLLYRYCIPAYRERLGTDILTTVPMMIATPAAFPRQLYVDMSESEKKQRRFDHIERKKRLDTIRRWTEHKLEKMNFRHEADFFSFSAASLDELTPGELFYGSHWITPFDDNPRPLSTSIPLALKWRASPAP